jgi:signal transduction histidine kinase
MRERKQKEVELQQLAARLLSLQDDERRRLARELHDDTAQNMAALSMNLAAVKNLLGAEQEQAHEVLAKSEELNQQLQRDIRTLAYVLHPPSLDNLGLVSALGWLIRGFSERSGISVTFDQGPDIGRLVPEIELALYRVVQEGLTNIHRHSGSATAHISLVRESDSIVLVIADKGRGLSDSCIHQNADVIQSIGVGLPGMRERLRALGGKLELVSDGNGTVLTGTVPLTD